MILLSRNYPNKIRFDFHSSIKATLLSLIDEILFVKTMYTIFTLSDQMTYPSAIVKSHVFGYIFCMKRLQLLVRWQNVQKSKY